MQANKQKMEPYMVIFTAGTRKRGRHGRTEGEEGKINEINEKNVWMECQRESRKKGKVNQWKVRRYCDKRIYKRTTENN